MADHPELAAQCAAMTEKERDVMDILLSLPELIADLRVYGKDQLNANWGWKKRRSADYFPSTPFPSPSPSPPPELNNLKPRVAHTKVNAVKLNLAG